MSSNQLIENMLNFMPHLIHLSCFSAGILGVGIYFGKQSLSLSLFSLKKGCFFRGVDEILIW